MALHGGGHGKRVDLPSGMPQGQRKELEDAQAAVPSVPQENIGLGDPPPGPSIGRASDFPNESLFEGVAGGPGGGPESLVSPISLPDPDEDMMIDILPILEGIVNSRRLTSSRSRQMVRRIRSQVPAKSEIPPGS